MFYIKQQNACTHVLHVKHVLHVYCFSLDLVFRGAPGSYGELCRATESYGELRELRRATGSSGELRTRFLQFPTFLSLDPVFRGAPGSYGELRRATGPF